MSFNFRYVQLLKKWDDLKVTINNTQQQDLNKTDSFKQTVKSVMNLK